MVDISLSGVQETLFIPLVCRAIETKRADAICQDLKAVEIVDSLNGQLKKFENAGTVHLDVAVRTEIFDEMVSAFLARHPKSIVVNLGAGLDARFHRLDNGQVRWFELDLPDVIALRHQFYNESPRHRFVATDLSKPDWIQELGRTDEPVLLIAEGLFPYLTGETVRGLCEHCLEYLPGSEMLAQSISPNLVNRQAIIPGVKQTAAEFRWGIKSGREYEKWDKRIEFVADWALTARHRERWREETRKWWFVPFLESTMRRDLKISQLKFHAKDFRD